MKAKLKDGYEVEVMDSSLNNWNFIKVLRKIDKGDTACIVDAAEYLLGGEEEADKLAEHFSIDGVPQADKMVEALTEILESVGEAKNS